MGIVVVVKRLSAEVEAGADARAWHPPAAIKSSMDAITKLIAVSFRACEIASQE